MTGTQISTTVNSSLLAVIDQEAERRGMSRSGILRMLVVQYGMFPRDEMRSQWTESRNEE